MSDFLDKVNIDNVKNLVSNIKDKNIDLNSLFETNNLDGLRDNLNTLIDSMINRDDIDQNIKDKILKLKEMITHNIELPDYLDILKNIQNIQNEITSNLTSSQFDLYKQEQTEIEKFIKNLEFDDLNKIIQNAVNNINSAYSSPFSPVSPPFLSDDKEIQVITERKPIDKSENNSFILLIIFIFLLLLVIILFVMGIYCYNKRNQKNSNNRKSDYSKAELELSDSTDIRSF